MYNSSDCFYQRKYHIYLSILWARVATKAMNIEETTLQYNDEIIERCDIYDISLDVSSCVWGQNVKIGGYAFDLAQTLGWPYVPLVQKGHPHAPPCQIPSVLHHLQIAQLSGNYEELHMRISKRRHAPHSWHRKSPITIPSMIQTVPSTSRCSVRRRPGVWIGCCWNDFGHVWGVKVRLLESWNNMLQTCVTRVGKNVLTVWKQPIHGCKELNTVSANHMTWLKYWYRTHT